MNNTNSGDFEDAIAEAAKAAVAEAAARKVANAQREKQRREAKKAAKREAEEQEIEQLCRDIGFVRPDGISKESPPTLDHCYRILESQSWGFAYNELAQLNEFRADDLPWPKHYGRVLSDPLVLAIRLSLIEVFGIEFTNTQVEESLKALCYSHPYDPVLEYLDSLKWDGEKRIETWLSKYLSAEDTEYTRAVGRLWLMAAVARIKYPGIKFDNVLILEGEQGTEKSGTFEVLGGEWFSDSDLGNVKDKESAIQLQNIWIQELPELGLMRRNDLNDLKAFFSRTHDKYRGVYGKIAERRPRRCVFGATGNTGKNQGYLVDDTGNRRYWPVMTGEIHIDMLREDRDQLWAEAVQAWREAVQDLQPRNFRRAIELPRHLWAIAGEEQRARLIVDVWIDELRPWLDNPFHECGREHIEIDGSRYGEMIEPYLDEAGRITKIHSRIILGACLKISKAVRTKEHGRRLRAAMAAIGGWEYNDNLTAGNSKGIGGYIRMPEQG